MFLQGESLGDRLARLRESRGLTQRHVADSIGLSVQQVSEYERGRRNPPTDKLVALSDLYGVSTDYLVGKTDDPTPPGKRRKLTPEEQLAEMGLSGVWARGGDITQEDVEFFRKYLETQRRIREEGKQGKR